MNSQLKLWILPVLSLVNAVAGEHWAFLVAGSNGWVNYRHQADLCHAYHLLLRAGVPAKNIVTMFYDDVANSPNNPQPGVLINRPGGENVYEGVVKDYTAKDVTTANLLNVLMGNKEAMKGIGSGRVIESGPEDTVFLNIIDHGNPGMIDIIDKSLYADQLNDALKTMKRKGSYGKMAIFVEACDAGSMFDSIIDDDNNVFALTAAAPDEFSFVHSFDKDLETYVSDSFSAAWMELVEKMLTETGSLDMTLFNLYKAVRSAVTDSHVMIYGDFHLGFDSMATFFGSNGGIPISKPKNTVLIESLKKSDVEKVSSQDVPLHLLQKKLKESSNDEEKKSLQKQIDYIEDGRDTIDNAVLEAVEIIAAMDNKLISYLMYNKSRATLPIFGCYRQIIDIFTQNCINVDENPYATKHFYKFINICLKGINLTKVKGAFKSVCERESLNLLKGIY
ncbi:legumain [Nesidiocoris tenuis]|uniref:Legumain n=1 Tax=Nesidiocoris tenuis TaxID=355587 RepID=A0ABN7AFX8_9HEMI|nr:legumain [Nesidiocoris tenuis]